MERESERKQQNYSPKCSLQFTENPRPTETVFIFIIQLFSARRLFENVNDGDAVSSLIIYVKIS